ncbi:MAG: prefoldin subunit alpha [Candidatus Micrarchaeota archaeon]|nr:prefoldin subunit alpha [Candidatus Micrarchaeota archaeon]
MADDKDKREDEINRLFYLQSLYNQQYEALMNELTTMSLANAALERNMSLLDKRESIKGSNILVNAEGGTYFEANVKDLKKIITYVGGGYLVEKDTEQAKEFIKKSIEMSKSTIGRLTDDRKKLETEIMRVQYAIDAMQQGQ